MRGNVVIALGLIQQPVNLVACLTQRLSDTGQRVRSFAAIGLGTIGQSGNQVVPMLARTLGDPVVGVRANAAEALGMIGSPSQQSVPNLLALLYQHPQVVAVWPVLQAELIRPLQGSFRH